MSSRVNGNPSSRMSGYRSYDDNGVGAPGNTRRVIRYGGSTVVAVVLAVVRTVVVAVQVL